VATSILTFAEPDREQLSLQLAFDCGSDRLVHWRKGANRIRATQKQQAPIETPETTTSKPQL